MRCPSCGPAPRPPRPGPARAHPPHDLLALRRPPQRLQVRHHLAARRGQHLPPPPDLARAIRSRPQQRPVRRRQPARDPPRPATALPAGPTPRPPDSRPRVRRGSPHHCSLGTARVPQRPADPSDPRVRPQPPDRPTSAGRPHHAGRDLPRDRRPGPRARHASLASSHRTRRQERAPPVPARHRPAAWNRVPPRNSVYDPLFGWFQKRHGLSRRSAFDDLPHDQ